MNARMDEKSHKREKKRKHLNEGPERQFRVNKETHQKHFFPRLHQKVSVGAVSRKVEEKK